MITRRSGLAALASGLTLATRPVLAQEHYPDHPPRLVVPYGAGSATDLIARQLAGKVGDLLGQRPVVENRAGAGGIVGAEFVAHGPPDGYTMLFAGSQTHAININLYQRLPYDPVADFTPIARVASQPLVLVVHPNVPAHSVAELIALAKARPGQLNYASSGIGTSAHLSGSTLRSQAGIDIVHVPYSGGGQLFTDLLSGATSMMFYPYQALRPHVEAGKLRVLASTGATRPAWLANVPTMVEAGFPDFVLTAWFGVFGPAGMAAARVETVSDAIRRAVADPEILAAFTVSGTDALYAPPAEFKTFIASEIQRYAKVVADSGAKVE
ncbi:tripartite-type tricarboxylate transporter receptor subunit TctC [Humitalea rosea]|uniref:Tripartite-type tricarboxylate transporter receptor subunit TctC n=1 Tax=Humitalea rosea TaxID=990373 RepID=A0A2W7I227_9PROT|nr:tripartite tricarboxylate transporter substrate binding protein [Humitalea rosea]PZW39305.1 tripartite-type tricarboxylate transporter receptor subunit TctC [Humitalea rosea]